MSTEQIKIYLDRDQCDDFEIEYFESCEASLPADAILKSKRVGYDRHHREILEPLGDMLVSLERDGKVPEISGQEWDAPGWYRIITTDVSMS